jgi:hypothetical protein
MLNKSSESGYSCLPTDFKRNNSNFSSSTIMWTYGSIMYSLCYVEICFLYNYIIEHLSWRILGLSNVFWYIFRWSADFCPSLWWCDILYILKCILLCGDLIINVFYVLNIIHSCIPEINPLWS